MANLTVLWNALSCTFDVMICAAMSTGAIATVLYMKYGSSMMALAVPNTVSFVPGRLPFLLNEWYDMRFFCLSSSNLSSMGARESKAIACSISSACLRLFSRVSAGFFSFIGE